MRNADAVRTRDRSATTSRRHEETQVSPSCLRVLRGGSVCLEVDRDDVIADADAELRDGHVPLVRLIRDESWNSNSHDAFSSTHSCTSSSSSSSGSRYAVPYGLARATVSAPLFTSASV